MRSVSPVKTALLSSKIREMQPPVCPGVSNTVKECFPKVNLSPFVFYKHFKNKIPSFTLMRRSEYSIGFPFKSLALIPRTDFASGY